MKIAALIRAYHRPEQLAQLLDRLQGDLWAPYVHIDAKSDVRAFDHLRDRATFVDERTAVYWGGLSQVESALTVLRAALRDPAVTHFYNMSGQCYPVKTDAQIRARLAALPVGTANLIELQAMPAPSKCMTRYTRRYAHDMKHPLVRKVANKLFRRLPPRPLAPLRGIRLFGGGCWWLFERETVRRILGFIDENPWFLPLFKRSNCADEMLFHSLIEPLGIRVADTQPTADIWVDGADHPEPITAELHQQLTAGPALFARKYMSWHPANA